MLKWHVQVCTDMHCKQQLQLVCFSPGDQKHYTACLQCYHYCHVYHPCSFANSDQMRYLIRYPHPSSSELKILLGLCAWVIFPLS